jgi:hypothetical protein
MTDVPRRGALHRSVSGWGCAHHRKRLVDAPIRHGYNVR